MVRSGWWRVPADAEPDPRVERGQLIRQADWDTARRTMHGSWAAILGFLAIIFSSSYFEQHPRVVAGAAVCLLAIFSLRLYSAGRLDGPRGHAWKKLYFSSIVLSGAYWGVFCGITVRLYGWEHRTALIAVVCAAAICATATISFAPNFRLMSAFLIAVLAPPLPIYFMIGGERGWTMALAAVAFLAFSMVQGRNRSTEYWQALCDTALLKVWSADSMRTQMALEQTHQQLENRILERTLELVRANSDLLVREEQFRRLVEQAANGIFISNPEGYYVEVNSSACAMTGYSREELLGKPAFYLVSDETAVFSAPVLSRVQTGGTMQGETRLKRKDGSSIDVEFTANKLSDGRILALVRDITGRKAAEEKIKKSEHQLAEAERVAHVGGWEWDIQTGECEWTDELYRIFGFQPREMPVNYNVFMSMVHEDDRDRILRAIESSTVKLAPYEYEARIIRRDGSVRTGHCQAEVLRDNSGQAVRMLGTFQDITERKLLEEQLSRSQKMELVGQLAGGVAHDFNNLLTVISGCANMLQMDLDPADPLRAEVTEILLAAERATSLTGQLLAFSHRQVIQPEILDLNAIVVKMENLLRRLLPEDIELSTRLAPVLVLIRADSVQVEQVIMNLVVNARDAMTQGGRVLVETSNKEVQDSLFAVLKVADTGCGMNDQTRSRIFEPFFTTKGPGKGSGLGLATVYGIVQQGGGFISVESQPGLGSTFEVCLPRAASAAPPSSPPAEARPLRKTGTILLVEDDAAVRRTTQQMLLRLGNTVLVADGMDAAREVCESHRGPIDLLLTDVIMTGAGVRDLAGELRAMRPGLRVLYMSGHTDDVMIHYGVLDPGVAFLKKPFTPRAISSKIAQLIQ